MTTELTEKLKQKVKKGVSTLLDGGVIAYPTDTVYGLGACSDNVQAVKRIYKVKNRSLDMPLPILLPGVSWIERVAGSISDRAFSLVNSFMPGAITLVVKKADFVSDIVSGGKETVAFRIPDHPVTIALIKGAGVPLIGTSANMTGNASALNAEDVRKQLGEKIDYILDGGRCPGGKESSIVDVTGDIPVLLREGAISKADIEKICEIISYGEDN
jgi:L-threonylcarbamoyladenylate synthase